MDALVVAIKLVGYLAMRQQAWLLLSSPLFLTSKRYLSLSHAMPSHSYRSHVPEPTRRARENSRRHHAEYRNQDHGRVALEGKRLSQHRHSYVARPRSLLHAVAAQRDQREEGETKSTAYIQSWLR